VTNGMGMIAWLFFLVREQHIESSIGGELFASERGLWSCLPQGPAESPLKIKTDSYLWNVVENSREPPDDALYCLIIFLSGSGSAAATSQTIQPQSYTNSPSVVGANVYHRFVRIKQMLNLMLKQHYNYKCIS